MGKLRFVQPKTERLALSDGDWIDVKHELSVGEQRRAFVKGIHGTLGGPIERNFDQAAKAEILEYIVAWSFRDAADKPVAVEETAFDSLTLETYKEIEQAIEAHKARVAAGKTTPGGLESSETSPSAG